MITKDYRILMETKLQTKHVVFWHKESSPDNFIHLEEHKRE
jgi:hypothetical protein